MYAFQDAEAMKTARSQMQGMPIALASLKLSESEVKKYVRSFANGYQNYLGQGSDERCPTAVASFISALQALHRLNRYRARYIVIEELSVPEHLDG